MRLLLRIGGSSRRRARLVGRLVSRLWGVLGLVVLLVLLGLVLVVLVMLVVMGVLVMMEKAAEILVLVVFT